jgi:hypothetical protein
LASRFLTRFIPIEREDRLFVAPEARSRYYLTPPQGGPHAPNTPVGASWMTSEDREHEIEDYVRYLDLLYAEIFSVVPRKGAKPDLVAAEQSRLKELNVPHEIIRFDGGHEIVPDTLRSLAETHGS